MFDFSLKYYVVLIDSLRYARTFLLLEFLAEAFQCYVHHFQCLRVPGLFIIFNVAGSGLSIIETLLLRTQISEKFFISEVNLLIQHIIMQDQDGQNNKIKILFSSRNGYSFETAMLLSIFLGMFGADRFYLGYPAIGLLKFCTLGFMFLGQLVDIILIATQVVGPADGSHYVIPFYGAGIEVIRSNNWTYKLPQNDW